MINCIFLKIFFIIILFKSREAAFSAEGTHISVLQNMERGKSEERPEAFHLYLSIFHFGQIKGKPWEKKKKKLGRQLVLVSAPKAKTKRTLSGGHLCLVAVWDLP